MRAHSLSLLNWLKLERKQASKDLTLFIWMSWNVERFKRKSLFVAESVAKPLVLLYHVFLIVVEIGNELFQYEFHSFHS